MTSANEQAKKKLLADIFKLETKKGKSIHTLYKDTLQPSKDWKTWKPITMPKAGDPGYYRNDMTDWHVDLGGSSSGPPVQIGDTPMTSQLNALLPHKNVTVRRKKTKKSNLKKKGAKKSNKKVSFLLDPNHRVKKRTRKRKHPQKRKNRDLRTMMRKNRDLRTMVKKVHLEIHTWENWPITSKQEEIKGEQVDCG
ncbi:hypothetical protein OS493_022099 [Desmophyllum pertusum]|uniref:Uncharacterized protein n=1 Tax=Desmophyllum pertusum TaxID=174260 RepID=A0A9X0CJW5_9CNID|nr:hypothetical protein OS493_022099 [Desmophyllum pertusum]